MVLYYVNKNDLAVNITYFFLSFLVTPQVSSEDVSNANFYQTPKTNFCVFLSDGGLSTPSACPTKPHHNLASTVTVSNI